MKLRKVLSLILILALALTPLASASQAMGQELHKAVTVLGDGLVLTEQIIWSDSKSDYRREKYVTYTPGAGVVPRVVYGSVVPTKSVLTTMAKGLEKAGCRVLCGANADYFVMASGVPLGMVITDGVIRSSSSYHHALGFRADGSAFIGTPGMGIWVETEGMGYPVIVNGGYNKSRGLDGPFVLLNENFGSSTGGSGNAIYVTLRPVAVPEDYQVPLPGPTVDEETGEEIPPSQEALDAALAASAAALPSVTPALTVGGTLTCVVEELREAKGAVSIPSGRFVLALSTSADDFHKDMLRSLRAGEQVKLSATVEDQRWAAAVSAIGGMAILVENGVRNPDLAKIDTKTNDPRTAVGIRADGQVVLYSLDGRQKGHSIGSSLNQLADRFIELGCAQALLFDGGGSTSFGTTGAVDSAFSLKNKPSEGTQRAVTNALFFLSSLEATGEPGSLYITPHDGLLLSGAAVELSATAVDTGFYPMYALAEGSVAYTAQGPGAVEGSVLTAGRDPGVVTVTGETVGITGEALFTVISTPQAITLSNEATGKAVTSLNLDPGERVALTADATWYKLPLTDRDSCYAWSCDPALGTIDDEGTFTAGLKGGAGNIYVSAGGKTVSLPTTVAAHILPLEDFEGDWGGFADRADPARGRQNGTLSDTNGADTLTLDASIPHGETHLGLFVRTLGEAALSARFTLADGAETEVPLLAGDYPQWTQLCLPLPEGAAALNSLTARGGTVKVDHLTTANQYLLDDTPPALTLGVKGTAVTATVTDNVDKRLDKALLSLTLDGEVLDFTLSGKNLSAQLPKGLTGTHRLTLTAADASGNLARKSMDLGTYDPEENPFDDTGDHWAASYAAYLYRRGVTTGSVENGQTNYHPGDNITRAEFATMLARWLGADLSPWDQGKLPFADAGDIPGWASAPIRYLHAGGVFAGSAEGGRLYAHPNSSITRAEAMALLYRVQPKGYPLGTALFEDDGDIPSWARRGVYTLTGLGVVSGYQGEVRPGDPITRGEAAKLFTALR